MIACKQSHKELLSLWDIKGGGTSSSHVRDLNRSWSCPHCTYLNDSSTTLDICAACESTCAYRRYEVDRQKIAMESLAGKAADSLSIQNELLKDLFEDSDCEDISGLDNTSSKLTPTIPEKYSYLSVAPLTAGKQLHKILLCDLLLDCLSYLRDPRDILSLMLVCKYFSFIADSDIIWWPFQSRFINDSSSESSVGATDIPSLPSPSLVNGGVGGSDLLDSDRFRSGTWICTVCQLTQALATSSICEMCHAERPVAISSVQRDLPDVVQTAFIILKSPEHLAALWIEGNRQSRERENSLMHIASPPQLQLSGCQVEYVTPQVESDLSSRLSAGNYQVYGSSENSR